MPTVLQPRRAPEKRSLARKIFDIVFNTALVVSALILTFIVLVRQEQYAFGEQQDISQTIEQAARGPVDMTGERMIIPPSN